MVATTMPETDVQETLSRSVGGGGTGARLRDMLKQAAETEASRVDCPRCRHGFPVLTEGAAPSLIACPGCEEQLVIVQLNGAPQTLRYRAWLKAASSGCFDGGPAQSPAPPHGVSDSGTPPAPEVLTFPVGKPVPGRSWAPWFILGCVVLATAGLTVTPLGERVRARFQKKDAPSTARPRPAAPPPAAATSRADEPTASPVNDAQPTAKLALQQQARSVLDRFLAGPVTVRTALSLPDKAGGLPDAPVEVTRVQHLDSVVHPLRGTTVSTFRVHTPARPDGALVEVWHTPDGPKVNGLLFAEQNQWLLREFLAHKAGEDITLHARLTLFHSFDREAPDNAAYLCTRVEDPVDGSISARAFTDLLFKEAATLSSSLGWSEPRLMRVRLMWSPARPERGAPKPFLTIHSVLESGPPPAGK